MDSRKSLLKGIDKRNVFKMAAVFKVKNIEVKNNKKKIHTSSIISGLYLCTGNRNIYTVIQKIPVFTGIMVFCFFIRIWIKTPF